jgi:hypothetical protein
MSIFAGLGAAPAKLTVPLTLAAVAGSIGVAAGAGVAEEFVGAADSSELVSFLLQAVKRARQISMLRPITVTHGL